MPREFAVPSFYRSPAILAVKNARRTADPRRKDLSPTVLDFGPVKIFLARHFGFCFGVENAIEIAYRVLEENPQRRVFLLSEMIHNPQVNQDLLQRGVKFLMNPEGTRLLDFATLRPNDIVLVPAFCTTVELQEELKSLGIDPYRYDATCPFVEKVWKRADELGRQGFTVVIHGKRLHEETRATFSHSKQTAPTLVVRNMEEAKMVISVIKGERDFLYFAEHFSECVSPNFDPAVHLQRIGVVNQTTMLASETQEIATAFRQAMLEVHGAEQLAQHFADTRDTLCYATNENQSAVRALRETNADLALIVGGYNSSNTSHLAALCSETLPSYYICGPEEILSATALRHFDYATKKTTVCENWLPAAPVSLAITAGASCPDVVVESVMNRVLQFFPEARRLEEVADYIKL